MNADGTMDYKYAKFLELTSIILHYYTTPNKLYSLNKI